jgi:hypothetical protein
VGAWPSPNPDSLSSYSHRHLPIQALVPPPDPRATAATIPISLSSLSALHTTAVAILCYGYAAAGHPQVACTPSPSHATPPLIIVLRYAATRRRRHRFRWFGPACRPWLTGMPAGMGYLRITDADSNSYPWRVVGTGTGTVFGTWVQAYKHTIRG